MSKKNKAINKTEKLSSPKAEQIKQDMQNAEISANSTINDQNPPVLNAEMYSEPTKNKQSIFAPRKLSEQEKAEKRMELARKKDRIKAEKRAKKLEHKKRFEQWKEHLKQAREQRNQALLERREMLKNESKEERALRIKAEKEQRRADAQKAHEHRIMLKKEKIKLRKQKQSARFALREQKRRLRAEERKSKPNRGFGGWLAAVISLGCAVLVLGTLFTFSLLGNMGGNNMYENATRRSYYELVSYVENMDVNLSKLMVSNSAKEQQRLLGDLCVQSSLASSDIAMLPLEDDARYYTAKYLNQVNDYSKYLNNKLIDGGTVSQDDKDNIYNLYQINNVLKAELTQTTQSLGNDFEFASMLGKDKSNAVLDSFVSMEALSVDYPKMIYDGPFSDAKTERQPKGLGENEISQTEAMDIFNSIFAEYSITNATVESQLNSKIPCYAVSGDYDGGSIYAEISKVGGKLVLFNNFVDCFVENKTQNECIEIAESFLSELGIENMKAVWATVNNGVCYVNICHEQNGVIIYPDMIKVSVCQERGVVSAFDATEYYLNHTTRTVGKPLISKQNAISNLSTNLTVESVRLAVVPKGEQKEILCYEVCGTFLDSTYYIYVDASNGNEVNVFRVVETTEGTLIM